MNRAFWSGKKVLITGGSGFIGRWVARALADCQVELQIVDLRPPTDFDVPHRFHEIDLGSLSNCREMLSRTAPDVVLHLAGQPGVGASHDNPVGAFAANVTATFNLLEACRSYGRLSSVVAVSSNHVYGEQHQLRTAEDAPLNGHGPYAATKVAADVLAQCYGKSYGVPVGIARMTNSFGGDDHHVTHIITASILSALRGERPIIKQSGRDRKGYLYVKDTAEGLLAVAEGAALKSELAGEAFNIVPNEALTVLEVVQQVQEAVGLNAAPVVERPESHFECEHLDNSKARRLLGWTPRYSLRDALTETVAWYREHRSTSSH